jgi:uncharacterized repeat protein (TIGR01451 family)
VGSGTAPGTYAASASVVAAEADPDPANNEDGEDTTVGALEADLRIDKTASVAEIEAGASFSYAITVTNDGPADATNVVIDDPVPSAFAVTGATAAEGTCVVTGNAVGCSLATLAAGASWTVTISARAGETPGATTNTATVSSHVTDPEPSNDADGADVTVLEPAEEDGADETTPDVTALVAEAPPAAEETLAEEAVTEASVAPTTALATTGAPTARLAALALGLVAAGVAMVGVAARRRRDASAS